MNAKVGVAIGTFFIVLVPSHVSAEPTMSEARDFILEYLPKCRPGIPASGVRLDGQVFEFRASSPAGPITFVVDLTEIRVDSAGDFFSAKCITGTCIAERRRDGTTTRTDSFIEECGGEKLGMRLGKALEHYTKFLPKKTTPF